MDKRISSAPATGSIDIDLKGERDAGDGCGKTPDSNDLDQFGVAEEALRIFERSFVRLGPLN